MSKKNDHHEDSFEFSQLIEQSRRIPMALSRGDQLFAVHRLSSNNPWWKPCVWLSLNKVKMKKKVYLSVCVCMSVSVHLHPLSHVEISDHSQVFVTRYRYRCIHTHWNGRTDRSEKMERSQIERDTSDIRTHTFKSQQNT